MYRSRTKLGNKARTIGVMVDYLGGPYQSTVLSGIADTAGRLGTNVLCFALGAVAARKEAVAGGKGIHQLMGTHNVDSAILISSTLTDGTGTEGLLRLARSYAGLRLSSVGVELEGIPSVTVDNRAGVREAVAHLVRAHHLQRIAFVRGPDHHAEAEERLDAYRSELAAQEIPFDPKLALPGDFLPEAGRKAVRTLAERPGWLDSVGAIMACNDQMALGVLAELEKMNIRVPETIAVVGFDDIEEARFSQPALATVRQPLANMGSEAVRRVVDFSGRTEPATSIEIKTELITRRSCGCAEQFKVTRASLPPQENTSFESALLQHRQRIMIKLARAAGGSFGPAGRDWEGKLLTTFASHLRNGNASEFVTAVEAVAERLLSGGVDVNLVDHVLGVLRQETLPLLRNNGKLRDCAEETFHACRMTTSSLIQRGLNRDRLKLGLWTRTTAFACNSLATTFDYDLLRKRIKEELPKLGIRRCFVALYDPGPEIKAARLFAAFDAESPRQWPEGVVFQAKNLLPPEIVNAEGEGGSFAVLPLVCCGELLGHIMLDFDVMHNFAHEAIAEAIGGGLYGAKLAGSALR